MKNYLLASLLVFVSGSTLAMDEITTPQDKSLPASISPFSIPDINFIIIEHLFRTMDADEAIKAFTRYVSLNKESHEFFRSSVERTLDFARRLHMLSYHDDTFNNKLLENLDLLAEKFSILNQEGVATFQGGLFIGKKTLPNLFGECAFGQCAENLKKWNVALGILYGLKSSTVNVVMHSWGSTDYQTIRVRLTPLLWALIHNAPKKVIKILIDYGSPLKGFRCITPPPCFIIVINFLEHQNNLAQRRLAKHADLSQIEKEEILRINQFEEMMDLLNEGGACINDSFKIPYGLCPTPLSLAIKLGNSNLIQSLTNRGAYADSALLTTTAELFLKGECSSDIMELVLSHSDASKFLYTLMSGRLFRLFQDKEPEGLLQLFSSILKNVDVRIPYKERVYGEDVTFLDLARGFSCDEGIRNLIAEKGAIILCNDQKIHRMLNFAARKNKLSSLTTLKREEVIVELVPILKEAQAFVQDYGLDALPSSVIEDLIQLALYWWKFLDTVELLLATAELLKEIDAQGSFFFMDNYYQVTSVFHALVAKLYEESKKPNPDYYWFQLKLVSPLILKLAELGVKDVILSEEMTAVQKAHELGMPELANVITKDGGAYLHWAGAAQSGNKEMVQFFIDKGLNINDRYDSEDEDE